jgi:DUF177 domain-containing protein
MDDAFKIYVEQLRNGEIEKLEETFAPDFLDVQEKELSFPEPVTLSGEAYLASEDLILHLDVSFVVQLPCVICNKPVREEIAIKGAYQTIPLSQVKSGIFNFRELLREMILLETPHFAECEGGRCPERKAIAKYLKETSSSEEEGYQPFADLNKE